MNNFTPRAQQVLALARKEADRFHHTYVGTEHILLGLINLGQGVAVNVLQKLGLNLESVRDAVEKQVGTGPETKPTGNIPYTPRVKQVLALASKEAKALNHSYVGTEHILLGLLREGDGVAARVLKALEIDIERCRNEILIELDPNFAENPEAEGAAVAGASEDKREIKTPALKSFGRDLTEMARKGELDPVIGRAKEIRRVVQILCRRTKNNPVLIGEAGVGKTAIVEGLAQEIVSGVVPEILIDKKVITLDLALMVAGTKYRGQFEERIKAVMDEIRKTKNVILFIDEMHTMVGAGAAEGAMDASNILKPALSRGEMQCIGATTLGEYRKHIEKDSALDRRFQAVKVEAPSVEDSIEILKGIKVKYEEHHRVEFTPEAIETAVRFSDRYISGRFLPDKAIDVLDESGARARIDALSRPPEVEELSKEIDRVCTLKEDAISHQNFEDAAKHRDQERQLRKKREDMLESWKTHREEKKIVVSDDDIHQVVADWTGIPLQRMAQQDSERLLKLEADLQEDVVGQDEAVIAISKALRRSRADLKDPRRPIGSFLFLGPTGVGKTHLAKILADRMFGDRDAIIQVDMSEYMEKFTVSRLIGSPPGYVGHEEGGQLTEAIRRKPYSVILLDEIEKAHPDVVQLLLQVLEEGRLTDSLGRRVDFRNTILIMTSNVGADILQKNASMGFTMDEASLSDFERAKDRILEETRRTFKPEFLNRLTDIIIFRPLSKGQLKAIVEIELRNMSERLASREIRFTLTEAAKALLIDKGFDEKYGARPLRRAIEKYIEDPLAEEILAGSLKVGELMEIDCEDGKLVFRQNDLTSPANGGS